MNKKCYKCSKKLKKDEMALNKKLLGKNIQQILCLECLSEYLGIEKKVLEEKIVQFKEDGCTLFE